MMTHHHHITTLLLAFIVQIGMATNDVKLRLNPNLYDPSSQSVYVDLEIAYDGGGHFSLADQNYRLYFDANAMSLIMDQSNSDLPSDQYGPINFHEVIEGIDASHVNDLSFDSELGFINFSIDLVNDAEGGLNIKRDHGWERIAILKFKLNSKSPSQIVWGREAATSAYATAFVEIMEWKGPNWTVPAAVDFYEDATVDLERNKSNSVINFEVAPNPSVDFIRLTFDKPIASGSLNIYDMLGKSVYDLMLQGDIQDVKIATTDLAAGNYTLEVMDTKTGMVHKENFIKVMK